MSDWSEQFGTVLYNERLVTNLTRRYVIDEIETDFDVGFVKERVKFNETIEEMAYRLYDDTSLWWIIAFVNRIKRPEDWPQSDEVLQETTELRYGDRKDETLYWLENGSQSAKRVRKSFKDENGVVIDYYDTGDGLGNSRFEFFNNRGVPVSYEDDEFIRNEQKIFMRVPSRDNVGDFISLFRQAQ